jgi:hypothetical protein
VAADRRSKQYAGNVDATVGGSTLNIDRDLVAAQWSIYSRLLAALLRRPCAPVRRRNQFARTAVDS